MACEVTAVMLSAAAASGQLAIYQSVVVCLPAACHVIGLGPMRDDLLQGNIKDRICQVCDGRLHGDEQE